MSRRDDFEDQDNGQGSDEEQPKPRRKRPDSDLSNERQAEEAPRSRRPRKAAEQAWNDAEQKVKARSNKAQGDKAADNAGKPAKRKPADKKKSAPAKPVDRGKWRNGTLRQRYARIKWIFWGPYSLAWLFVILVLAYLVPNLLRGSGKPPAIAPFFTPEIQHWAPDIAKWSTQYGVNANLIATLMQIESCGFPGAASGVGAQGLFQVMPFNFQEGDNMTEPETNAQRGIGVLRDCLRYADGDVGLAMACYNGGPGLISRDPSGWPTESQRYYTWGTGIYNEAVRGLSKSPTLDNWLQSGGVGLCRQAAVALGINPSEGSPAFVAPPTNASNSQPGNQPTFPAAPPPVIVSSPIPSATRVVNGTPSNNATSTPTHTPTLGVRLFLTPTNTSP